MSVGKGEVTIMYWAKQHSGWVLNRCREQQGPTSPLIIMEQLFSTLISIHKVLLHSVTLKSPLPTLPIKGRLTGSAVLFSNLRMHRVNTNDLIRHSLCTGIPFLDLIELSSFRSWPEYWLIIGCRARMINQGADFLRLCSLTLRYTMQFR